MDLRRTFYGLDLKEATEILATLGEPAYRARQLLGWLYDRHADSWEGISNLPKPLLGKLEEKFPLKPASKRGR